MLSHNSSAGTLAPEWGAGGKATSSLAALGAVLTVTDAAMKGKWENHHTADLVVNATFTGFGMLASTAAASAAIPGVNIVVAAIGITYFITDLGFQLTTGKSITEHLFD